MQEVFLIGILAWITYTDIKNRRIPNAALLLAIAVRVLFFLRMEGVDLLEFGALCIDGLLVSVPLAILVMALDRFWNKQTMGGGDIKLVFVTGLYLGWEKNLVMLWIAAVLALVYAVLRKKNEFAFGPAIAIATMISLCIYLI